MFINAIHLRNIGIILGILLCGNSHAQKKIEVINFATFHMSYTPDAHKVNFDEKDKKNRDETLKIAKLLAAFKPTIICVEIVPQKNKELNIDYTSFIEDKAYKTKFGGEVALMPMKLANLQE